MYTTLHKLSLGLLFLFLGGSSCSSPVLAQSQKAPQKPNIVFIFSDDLSFRDISAYGQQQYKTPNIDRLIQHSTRFTQAYTAAPECAPSRGCILTGLHVGNGPIKLNSSARGEEYIPDSLYTMAEMLKDGGYTNGVVGKWGIGYKGTEGTPLKQGFDYHFGYYSHYEAHSYFPFFLFENDKKIEYPGNQDISIDFLYSKESKPDSYDYAGMYDKNGKLKWMQQENRVYASDILDQKALNFIEGNKENPFFLYLTTNLPHGPVIVDDLRDLSDRKDIAIRSREWAAMVVRLDISVGKVIDKLKEEGVYDNTIILFASDNGYAMWRPNQSNGQRIWPDDPHLSNKGPFKGGKFYLDEGGMRVPFFVHLPGQQQPRIENTPVWLVDLYPTLADVAGVNLSQLSLDGYSLWPLLQKHQNTIPDSRHMYFAKRNEQAVRRGPWYAHREHPDQPTRLYLLAEDQHCEADLAPYYPEIAQELSAIMDTSHQSHPWYWNPGESAANFAKKKEQARASNEVFPAYRPNGMKLMPWEKEN